MVLLRTPERRWLEEMGTRSWLRVQPIEPGGRVVDFGPWGAPPLPGVVVPVFDNNAWEHCSYLQASWGDWLRKVRAGVSWSVHDDPPKTDRLSLRELRAVEQGGRRCRHHHSWCHRCQTPWCRVSGHSTDYSPGSGCFPLCQVCWVELGSGEARLPFYRVLFDEWTASRLEALARGELWAQDDRDEHGPHEWALIELAVLAGN